MASSDTVKALEKQLEEAGNKLLKPPSSLEQLLSLLDQIENSLSKVEQSPAESTHSALSPLMKALVTDELLRHSDVDVKVSVASCISEITRITAPDAPYDDEKMKDVFQLIVSAFENLADKSSRSYKKRGLILETVSKVRSCVIMLDLECDELIAEMFQIFFRTIRDYHPETIFSSMETIMSLVLDESEEVSEELLIILLSGLKRHGEEISPIARRLAERVFESCAAKLKPCLKQAIESKKISSDDYSKIVSSVLDGATEQNNENASTEQPEFKDVVEEACQEVVDPAANRSPKSTMSNGISENKKEETSVQEEILEKQEHLDTNDKTTTDEVAPKSKSDDLGAEESTLSESNPEESARETGRKRNSSTKSTESSDPSHLDAEKESEKVVDTRESNEKDSDSSANDGKDLEDAKHMEKGKDVSDGEAQDVANVSSPSPSEGIADESLSKKGMILKEEEEIPSPDVVADKASDRTSDSESKPLKRIGKKAPHETTKKDKASVEVHTSKNEDGVTSDSEAKPRTQQGKKSDASDHEEGSSVKKKEDMKKRGRGKSGTEKNTMKSSTKNDAKEVSSTPKSSKKTTKEEDQKDDSHTKRKRTPGSEKGSGTLEYGENLVGSKVKVYWPHDRAYYDGVIDSFDAVKKKHKVLYNDGDEEILNLRKERWEFIEDDEGSDREEKAEPGSPGASSEMQKKKKAKRSGDSSGKHEAGEVSPKRKGKGTATKSGKKSKDDGKTDPKSRDGPSKSGGLSDDETPIKPRGHSQKASGKSVSDSVKLSGITKDVDSNPPKSKSKQDTSKSGGKSKEENSKTPAKSKGKTPQNGSKSSSSKAKDDADAKEKANESTKTPDGTKRKLSEKDREGETKSAKKRHRKS